MCVLAMNNYISTFCKVQTYPFLHISLQWRENSLSSRIYGHLFHMFDTWSIIRTDMDKWGTQHTPHCNLIHSCG